MNTLACCCIAHERTHHGLLTDTFDGDGGVTFGGAEEGRFVFIDGDVGMIVDAPKHGGGWI